MSVYDIWRYCGGCGKELREVPDSRRVRHYNRFTGEPLRDKACPDWAPTLPGVYTKALARPHDWLTEQEDDGVIQYEG